MNKPKPDTLTVAELAAQERVSTDTINRLINSGRLRALPGFTRPRRIARIAWQAYLTGAPSIGD